MTYILPRHIFTPISTKLLAVMEYRELVLKRKLFVDFYFYFCPSLLMAHTTSCSLLFNSCRLNKTQGGKNVDISVGRSMQWLIDVPNNTLHTRVMPNNPEHRYKALLVLLKSKIKEENIENEAHSVLTVSVYWFRL